MTRPEPIHRPAQARPDINPFRSFWMGGYECADHLNHHGDRVDLLNTTGHRERIHDDYRMLEPYRIRTVREGIRWSFVERRPYQYDWSVVRDMIEAGRAANIQQVWDLCHFGFPDDLSPLHPHFPRRFAALCRAFVRFYRDIDPDGTLIVTPINEVSFISWLGGERAGTTPFAIRMGWEVKYALMRAYIEGTAALREEDPSVRLLATEPLVQIVPPLDATPAEIEAAAEEHEHQYQMMDLLTGAICPELGGRPELLDILGLNYYYNNQWELGYKTFLRWVNEPFDPRWKPLGELILESYRRYGRPIVLAETSHPCEDRPHWINFVTSEVSELLREGIPFWGICLYPIIDRPDWNELSQWHCAGLWDANMDAGDPLRRVLYQPYADALLGCQATIREVLGERVAAG